MAVSGHGEGGVGVEWGGNCGEDERREDEGMDRDTRLLRASRDRVGGPRLRRS